MKNPKAENRKPKEGRSSKPEENWDSEAGLHTSSFWEWEVGEPSAPLILRETSPAYSPPDLLERTALFGEAVIEFAKQIPPSPLTNRLIDQLVGAATSIGANYCESDDAVSKRDSRNRIGTCRKESKETMFFLRLVVKAVPELAESARPLWREAKELNLIFGSIWRKLG